ncbi:MAG: Sortase family protein [candidate division WS6 bacterium OLB20]|uniref:Sortase family protein n=1 Tax=candidate division WS6 bacterium OLB20 TaxID=1617426 RepID=A0A136M0H3_9BACT|nr:MAG: Sortase family protein [candidate division WS6 bacterium OLB20]
METLLKISVIFAIASLAFLGASVIQFSTKQQPALNNTFVASGSNIAAIDATQTGAGQLDADYLIAADKDVFAEVTEDTIDPQGFYLRIDKIGLFKPVVLNVDPRDKQLYVNSWEQGISHGMFTATPDQIGITYLFAHAVGDETRAVEENAWFTYLDQLENGDEIIVYYKGYKYTYVTSEFFEVSPQATGFYTGASPVSKLRMQFCGPPRGSLAMRTLVDALLLTKEPVS